MAFLYRWHFLNKISLDLTLILTTQPSISKLSDNSGLLAFTAGRICSQPGNFASSWLLSPSLSIRSQKFPLAIAIFSHNKGFCGFVRNRTRLPQNPVQMFVLSIGQSKPLKYPRFDLVNPHGFSFFIYRAQKGRSIDNVLHLPVLSTSHADSFF